MNRLRAPLIAIVVVAGLTLGGALRVVPHLASPAGAAGGVGSQTVTYLDAPKLTTPTDPVARATVTFYRSVIQGQFDRAYDLSVELRQTGSEAGGLTSRQDFVASLRQEIGPDGLPVGIAALKVDWERPFSPASVATKEVPELAALRWLPGQSRLMLARVSGQLVGNCAIGTFFRTDVLAEVGGRWKVLLPGRAATSAAHFETWFLPRSGALGD
ncbi:MAG: hypothetical protein ACR2MZ_06500 [Candidatus Dormibacter sp.]|uniref:hypothetical protein n=1 Tax=Candidatus Dormibacter sp. TaxID=2973982 RepID=UPI000DB85424|nr:MAG: hypothetical protein DLM66_12070 [Candidatus Dormibacteraeota bacterium]